MSAFFCDIFPLLNPASALHYSGLVSACVVYVAWMIRRSRLPTVATDWRTQVLRPVADPRYWFNRSGRRDLQLLVVNGLLVAAFGSFYMHLSSFSSRATLDILARIGRPLEMEASGWPIALFAILAFLVSDFFMYLYHRASHEWTWLWKLHKVHHSARVLTPLTAFRAHPIDRLLGLACLSVLNAGVAGIYFHVFAAGEFHVPTLLGINALSFVFGASIFWLRHSHLPIGFGALERFCIMSPLQHQIHHSTLKEHLGKNLGLVLPWWDRLLGTIIYSDETEATRIFRTRDVRDSRAPTSGGQRRFSA